MRTLRYIGASTLALTFLLTCTVVAQYRTTLVANHALGNTAVVNFADDSISGEWEITFHVGEQSATGTFTLKVRGTKVTGNVFSQHTGPGTIRDGSWKDGKLNLTFEFEKHESIKIAGALKDKKLGGEFQTEGFTAKWEATKKATNSKQ